MFRNATKLYARVALSYVRDSAQLVGDLRDDERDGMKAKDFTT